MREEFYDNLLSKVNSTTQCVLEAVVNRLKNPKYSTSVDGVKWTKANLQYFAKPRNCCKRTVSNHLKLLKDLGIICVKQLSKDEGDSTNWHSLNPEALSSGVLEKIKDFFSPYLAQKMRDIIIRGRDTTYLSPPYKSKSPAGLEKSEASPQATSSVALGSASSVAPNSLRLKTTTAQDALSIWNKTTGREQAMTKPLARFLVAAIKLKFQTLEKWKEFCLLVKNSAFLMSKRFRAVLYYVLKFDVIDRILRGGCGCKTPVEPDRPKSAKESVESSESKKLINTQRLGVLNGAPSKPFSDFALRHIESLQEEEECVWIRRKILNKFGAEEYLAWMTKVSLTKDFQGNIKVLADNAFVRDRVCVQYVEKIDRNGFCEPACQPPKEKKSKPPESVQPKAVFGAHSLKQSFFRKDSFNKRLIDEQTSLEKIAV